MTKFAGAVWAALRGKRSTARYLTNERYTIMASVSKLPTTNNLEAGSAAWLKEHIARGIIEPHAEVTTLTPGLASILLQNNSTNRALRPVKIRHYADDMARGRWPLNGETIILSKEGMLNDGQNRCQALIEANTTIPVTIFFGADRDSRLTVDQGAARGAGAYLAMDGAQNANTQASVARFVISFEESDGKLIGGSDVGNSDVLERARRDAGIGAAADYAHKYAKGMQAFAAPAVIGACLYLLRHVDYDDANTYMEQVCGGEGLKKKDPAYTVRERLLAMGKGSRRDKVEIIFRGWNAFRQNRQLSIAKLMNSGLPAII